MSALIADMHPDRIATCFRTVGADGLPEGLLGDARFSGRLAEIVMRHYDLDDAGETADDADRVLVALTRGHLEKLAVRAGVVLHARQFVQEIRGPVLAALGERFGPAALDDARRHADLAVDMARTDDLDQLDAEVTRDGTACLAAWIDALPVSVKRRVRLKWPNDHAVPMTDDGRFQERGPAILRRLGTAESAAA